MKCMNLDFFFGKEISNLRTKFIQIFINIKKDLAWNIDKKKREREIVKLIVTKQKSHTKFYYCYRFNYQPNMLKK